MDQRGGRLGSVLLQPPTSVANIERQVLQY
jgi:hypothetical protein